MKPTSQMCSLTCFTPTVLPYPPQGRYSTKWKFTDATNSSIYTNPSAAAPGARTTA